MSSLLVSAQNGRAVVSGLALTPPAFAVLLSREELNRPEETRTPKRWLVRLNANPAKGRAPALPICILVDSATIGFRVVGCRDRARARIVTCGLTPATGCFRAYEAEFSGSPLAAPSLADPLKGSDTRKPPRFRLGGFSPLFGVATFSNLLRAARISKVVIAPELRTAPNLG